MTLWTPDGERPVRRQPEPQSPPPTPDDVIADFDDLSPEAREQATQLAAEMAQARKQIAETPASLIVANHVMGFYELAAIHLGDQPPGLQQAALAIDAMGAVIDALPGRLGENEDVLRQALQQVRLAYVSRSKEPSAEGGEAGSEPGSPAG